jgi:hypothetical protein
VPGIVWICVRASIAELATLHDDFQGSIPLLSGVGGRPKVFLLLGCNIQLMSPTKQADRSTQHVHGRAHLDIECTQSKLGVRKSVKQMNVCARTACIWMHASKWWTLDGTLACMQMNVIKLTRAVRPTTAPIGTDRLCAVLHTIGHRHGIRLRARRLLSISAHAVHQVRASDDAAAVNVQWRGLVAALRSPDTILVYHLENHYSLVFGAREWGVWGSVVDGVHGRRTARQVMVGQPGQKPNRWIAFEDVRACILGWQGYAVVQVERPQPDEKSADDSAGAL